MENAFKKQWRELEQQGPHPRFLRSIRKIDFQELRNKVESGDEKFAQEWTRSIWAGDAFIIEKTFSTDFLKDLRKKVFDWSHEVPTSSGKILDGVENFHEMVKQPLTDRPGGYTAIDHSHYFFPWNPDRLQIFENLRPVWRTFKKISGLSSNEYEDHIPSDGVVDRVQVIHYPSGAGQITTHFDPYKNQKMITGMNLTERGTDYETGGFYMVDSKKKRVDFEDQTSLGSMVVAFPGMFHGVDVVDAHRKEQTDWSKTDGRWYVALYSPDSHHMPSRQVAISSDENF